jgi:branched-chain amino acid transport system ATP-binding protein
MNDAAATAGGALLDVRGLAAQYGPTKVLHGVDFSVAEGGITAILGANGAGKSTLLRTVSGLQHPRSGTIRFDGSSIESMGPHEIVRLGISHVPEGRGMLSELTVLENLQLGAYARGGLKDLRELDGVFALFPVLSERRSQLAGMLSGGEQQMLAIARSLLARPRILMIDELSLGLAPKIAGALLQLLAKLRSDGLSILLVEQNVHQTLAVADRVYLLVNGRIGFHGTPDELRARKDVMDAYLGTEQAPQVQ